MRKISPYFFEKNSPQKDSYTVHACTKVLVLRFLYKNHRKNVCCVQTNNFQDKFSSSCNIRQKIVKQPHMHSNKFHCLMISLPCFIIDHRPQSSAPIACLYNSNNKTFVITGNFFFYLRICLIKSCIILNKYQVSLWLLLSQCSSTKPPTDTNLILYILSLTYFLPIIKS